MDRIKLLTESMKWWAGKVVDAKDADEVQFIIDQISHLKYEISNQIREAKSREMTSAPAEPAAIA